MFPRSLAGARWTLGRARMIAVCTRARRPVTTTVTASTYTPVEMITKLVGYDTTSRDSNLELIRFVEQYLAGHGVPSTVVLNHEGDKANLFATVGPERDGGVVLSGHSDVVPVDGQSWSSSPFSVIERDGRLYGRGTCDMKGFLGTVLALVPELQRAELRTPVHVALTYEEETTCEGARKLMNALPSIGVNPRAAIIGEPTEMKIINSHKGHYSCETVITGREGHSSLPDAGVNAIDAAAELIAALRDIGEELKARPCDIEGIEPPWTTINVGAIEGGVDFNLVPAHCRFVWELRPVPEQDAMEVLARFEERAQALLPAMQAVWPDAGIVNRLMLSVPALSPEDDAVAETLVKHLAGTNECYGVSYGTEAPYFQQGGMSCVVFGPGSISQAHKADEFLALEQVDACVDFLRRLMAHLAATTL